MERHLLPLALLVIAVLAPIVFGYVIFTIRRSLRKVASTSKSDRARNAEETTAGKVVTVDFTRTARLRDSSRRGMAHLRRHAGRDSLYQIPWFLMLGQTGSRSPAFLANAGLTLPYGIPLEEQRPSSLGFRWWLFDRGVVLDLAGEYVLREDGKTSDEGGWRTFLRLLQEQRPSRPIDGIILTLPGADLIEARDRPDRLAEIERKANLLSQRLWQALETLGFRLPVFVLVTGCERLEGFQGFTEALQSQSRDEIFGWSNPYGIDTGFRAEWVDEAFDTLRQGLDQARIRMFAEQTLPGEPGPVFVFPEEFDTLRDPLGGYLGHIFKPSAYHESVFLRGCYFCGTDAPGRVLFARELFERKVFSEANLATPTARRLLVRNRSVRRAQAALAVSAVVLTVGLWQASRQLAARELTLRPFLRLATLTTDEALRERDPDGKEEPRSVLGKHAADLLERMGEADLRWFGSVFIPSSWRPFSSFNSRLVVSIRRSFQQVIFPFFHLELDQRAREAIWAADLRRPGATTLEPQDVGIASMSEFRALQQHVDALVEIERNGRSYNRLTTRGEHDVPLLLSLANYALPGLVTPDLLIRDTLYREALSEFESSQKFDPKDYPAARSKGEELAHQFTQALFQSNALLQGLMNVATEVERMEVLSRGDETAQFERLLVTMERVDRIVKRSGASGELDLGPSFHILLDKATESEFFGPEFASRLRDESQRQTERLRETLKNLGFDAESEAAGLPSSLDSLRKAVETLLRERFMRATSADRPIVVLPPPGSRVRWDRPPLVEAVDLFKAYDKVRVEGLSNFPDKLRGRADEASRRRLESNVRDLVAQAQRLEPAPSFAQPASMKDAVDNFRTGAGWLSQIRIASRQVQMDELASELAGVMASQGEELLGQVDRLLEQDQLYLPRGGDLSWWDGREPVAFGAFEVRNKAGLAAYLLAQRERIDVLATQFAMPVIESLRVDGALPPGLLFARWDDIVRAIQDYKTRRPGGSMAALETYIASDLASLRLQNCLADETSAPSAQADPSQSTDGAPDESVAGRPANVAFHADEVSSDPTDGFFDERLLFLRKAVGDRCRSLASDSAASGYREIARFFNQRLAGRFPFTEDPPRGSGPEADPADLREFFRLFDRYESFIRLRLAEDRSLRGSSQAVRAFIQEMGGVRALLAPYLAAKDPTAPLTVDFEVEFRVNRELEQGGSEIIDWVLTAGKQEVRYRDEPRTTTWSLGDPVRFSLRWAKDGPRAPVNPSLGALASRDSPTVVYEYRDPWSFFRFLRAHRTPPGASEADAANPTTLRFAVETTGRAVAGGPPATLGQAIVFIRVGLVAKPPSLAAQLPRVFPTRAPDMARIRASVR